MIKYLNITTKEEDKKDAETLLKVAEQIKKEQLKIEKAYKKIKELQNNFKIEKYALIGANIETLDAMQTAKSILQYGHRDIL